MCVSMLYSWLSKALYLCLDRCLGSPCSMRADVDLRNVKGTTFPLCHTNACQPILTSFNTGTMSGASKPTLHNAFGSLTVGEHISNIFRNSAAGDKAIECQHTLPKVAMSKRNASISHVLTVRPGRNADACIKPQRCKPQCGSMLVNLFVNSVF